MKVVSSLGMSEESRREEAGSELDIQTIQRRVAQIKGRWSPEVAQSRAAEGARRRRELDQMISALLAQAAHSRPEPRAGHSCRHDLTLVG